MYSDVKRTRWAYELNYKGVTSEIEHFPQISCSVGISHSVQVPHDKRGQGLGKEAHEHRLKFARHVGFKYLVCTVRKDNEVQHKIMAKFGWKKLDSTDTYCHNIVMYGRSLEDIPYEPVEQVVK